LKKALKYIAAKGLGLIPSAGMNKLLMLVMDLYASGLPPKEGLKFLLELDNRLYALSGQAATRYGGGQHTKHRHVPYHDFFVGRIRQGMTVLDVGCGTGALTFDLAQKAGVKVMGIDLIESNIKRARNEYPHPQVEYMVGDALQDLPQRRFDAVVLSNVLEHIENRVEFLSSLLRTARPGRLLLRVPLFERDWRVPLKKELKVEWRLDSTHYTEYTQKTFEAELSAAGFGITYQETRFGEIWAEAKPIEA
jgi:SAM-dependent methyltransferase